MYTMVYRIPRFEKQLEQLRKADKKGAIAARKADEIIEGLVKGDAPEEAGVLTRHGECRIDNCMKYDLGRGYRLVTSQWENCLYILFVGTHDESHRWLENNKNWQPDETSRRGASPQVILPAPRKDRPKQEEDELEDWIGPIDEKALRVVFHALCNR